MGSIDIDVPFADVSLNQLRVLIGGTPPPALSEVVIAGDDRIPPLTLGVLGTSHVAFIGDRHSPLYVEEVSCSAEGGRRLDEVVDKRWDGPRVEVRRCASPQAFADEVARIRAELQREEKDAGWAAGGGQSDYIIAQFPGDDHAITALYGTRTESGYAWQTWHVYPPLDIVVTSTVWELTDRKEERA